MVGKPVGCPFPNIPDHIEQTVAVRGVVADRRGTLEAGRTKILPRKLAFPSVCHSDTLRREIVAPGEFGTFQSATSRELPLRFRRQRLAAPKCVGFGVFECDMHHGMIEACCDRAAATFRVTPVSARLPSPPIGYVAQIHRPSRRVEHQRSRPQHCRCDVWISRPVELSLCDGTISGRRDEGGKLTVGNQVRVDEKAVEAHLRYRRFLRIMAVGSHLKQAAGDPNHVPQFATEHPSLVRLQSDLHYPGSNATGTTHDRATGPYDIVMPQPG